MLAAQIDATITLEFLPTNRRWLLAALSTFQPVGVVLSTAIAYGLVPRYACATGLPACSTGQVPCCTKSSNIGWRATLIVLGGITLGIFVARFFVFTFEESPKYLLSRGRDQQAIDVLHRVAAFNKRSIPALTIEDFQAIDHESAFTTSSSSNEVVHEEPPARGTWLQVAKRNTLERAARLKALKGLVDTPVMAWMTACLVRPAINSWPSSDSRAQFVAYISLFWAFTIGASVLCRCEEAPLRPRAAGGYLPIILADRVSVFAQHHRHQADSGAGRQPRGLD